jgi:hypothetical protein
VTTDQTPELPPEVREQMVQQPPDPSVFAQAGQTAQQQGGPAQGGNPTQGGNPIAVLKQKLAEWEKITGEVFQMVQTIHPPSAALMVPVAQAGKALMQQVAQLEKRQAGGATPQQGPQPNPAEGVSARPMM